MSKNGMYRNGLYRTDLDGLGSNELYPDPAWVFNGEDFGQPRSDDQTHGDYGEEQLYTREEVEYLLAIERERCFSMVDRDRDRHIRFEWGRYWEDFVTIVEDIWLRPWIGWVIAFNILVIAYIIKQVF